jgi:phage gp46-like protein
MTDITTVWDSAANQGDWAMDGAALATGSDLATAVLISIFSDRQALPDDVIPDGTANRRGWWADSADRPIGSRLWLLSRAKQTGETRARAQDYIAEAVQWLIDDGVVIRFDLMVEWTRPGMLGVQLTAYKRDGSNEAMNFSWVWGNT